MNVPDGRRRQRLALVPDAAVVALVRLGDPVVDLPPPRAATTASPELAVERIQGLGVELADSHVPEARRDVVADVRAVELQRVRGAGELVEVTLEELVDGRARAGVALLGDLAEQSIAGRFGLALGLRARLDDLLEVVPLARHGVDARVDGHAESAARQRLDAPPCAALTGRGTSRHLGSVARFAPHLIP
ncbi:hypothetical protein GCM10017691_46790 [Pseudonocardia petroleophila]